MDSIKRSITEIIISRLNHEQVVALTGARQTGKTTLCEMQLPERLDLSFSYISFDDPDERPRFSALGRADSGKHHLTAGGA